MGVLEGGDVLKYRGVFEPGTTEETHIADPTITSEGQSPGDRVIDEPATTISGLRRITQELFKGR